MLEDFSQFNLLTRDGAAIRISCM